MKIEVTVPKKAQFFIIFGEIGQQLMFFDPETSFSTFLHFKKKYIDPSGYFVFYEIFVVLFFILTRGLQVSVAKKR